MSKQIFYESFDYKGGLDPSKWTYEEGGHGWGNKELQYYTSRKENVYVDNKLVIKAKKEDYLGNHYTSSKITTYQKQSFLYGSFRIVCKAPSSQGLWPAIWLLPESFKTNYNWPVCGEIDIFEHVSSQLGKLYFSLHNKEHNFKTNSQITSICDYPKILNEFVEVRMDWTKDYFKYYLDGVEVASFMRPANATNANWPYDQKQYLIINLAVGGSWPGSPSKDFIEDEFLIKSIEVLEIGSEND